MAFARSLFKLSFGGALYGDEIWANSLHIGSEIDSLPALSTETVQGFVNDAAELIEMWFTSQNTGISNKASLEWVKLARIGVDGKYLEDAVIYDFATPPVGQMSTERVAPQLTTVISMTTTVTRGRAKFGRIYPPVNVAVDSNGREMNAQPKATAFKELIVGLNGIFGGLGGNLSPFAVVVASNLDEGRTAYVTGVRVGNIVDTMRSRRNALREEYSHAAVPNPREGSFDGGGSGDF